MSAEKVDRFPGGAPGTPQLKYPWPEIARDGGIWRLNPADYGDVQLRSFQAAAAGWASRHGYRARTKTYEGALFVQFTTVNGRAS